MLAILHYVPLPDSPMRKNLGCAANDVSGARRVSERLLRPPFSCDLEECVLYARKLQLTKGIRITARISFFCPRYQRGWQ